MKKTDKVIFSVQMPVKMRKELDKICKKYGVSIGGLMRYVLNNYLIEMRECNNKDEDLERLVQISPDL